MFEFFNYESRSVIDELKPNATLLRHAHMGTEHLLLSIAKANTPLSQLIGISYSEILTSITDVIGYGSPLQGTVSWRPFTPELRGVVEESPHIMRANRHFPLTPLHLLQSMVAQDSAPTRVYLRHAGVDVNELLRRIEYQMRLLPSWSPFTTPHSQHVSLFQKQYTADEILHIVSPRGY